MKGGKQGLLTWKLIKKYLPGTPKKLKNTYLEPKKYLPENPKKILTWNPWKIKNTYLENLKTYLPGTPENQKRQKHLIAHT